MVNIFRSKTMRGKILATTIVLTTMGLAAPAIAKSYEPGHLKRLLETKQCPGCDLTSADLRGANLRYADLRGASLSNANLSNADLRGANLTGANLTNTKLTGAKR
jgi:uncharacterized protein YjbI with pentapeptide repeats